MKRVVLCVTNDLVYDQRLYRMAEALTSEGYNVSLVGRRLQESDQPSDQFKYVRFSCFLKTGALFYLEFNLRLILYLAFRKADIIVANDADTLLGCGMVSLLKRKKLVYDSHEWFTEVPELLNHPFKRRIWHVLQQIFVPRAHLCLTVGPRLAQRLSNLYDNIFHPILNLPPKWTSPRSESGEKVIIYQGTLNEDRGLEEAVAAMGQLRDWKLWMVGVGPLLDILKQEVYKHGVEDNVHFYGGVKPEVLREMTPKARLGLNLLTGKSKNYYFSLANKYFDYIQSGVPVITMNYPEYRTLNEECATSILLDKCTVQSIVEAVRTFEAPTYYEARRSACLKGSQIWYWEKEKERLLSLYRGLH